MTSDYIPPLGDFQPADVVATELDRELCEFCGYLVETPCDVPPPGFCDEAERAVLRAWP